MRSWRGPVKSMAEQDMIEIEIACAWPDKQIIRSLRVPAGTEARQALLHSGLADELAAMSMDIETVALGVFGRVVEDTYAPRNGDRIEVYRPLHRDPREARRLRATTKKGSAK